MNMSRNQLRQKLTQLLNEVEMMIDFGDAGMNLQHVRRELKGALAADMNGGAETDEEELVEITEEAPGTSN